MRRGDDYLFRKMAVGDMVLVTQGDQFPFTRQAVSIEGMVGSSFLHIAVARWPEGVWQARRDAAGARFCVDK
jgi:hypothetical protein